MDYSPLSTKNGFATDSDANRLEQVLRCRLGSSVLDLRVELKDGGLVLYGRARTFYAKQLAQQEVMKQTDQPIVANEIEVN